MRPTQHFDSREVEGVEVGGHHCRVGETAARSERHVIAINTHGRGNATCVDAAHCETRRTRFGSGHRQARDQRREVLKVLDTALFQRVAGENRDRSRNLHERLRTLLRCHDHVLTVGHERQPEVLRHGLAGAQLDGPGFGSEGVKRCVQSVISRRQIRNLEGACLVCRGRSRTSIAGNRYDCARERCSAGIRDFPLEGGVCLSPEGRPAHQRGKHRNQDHLAISHAASVLLCPHIYILCCSRSNTNNIC